MVERVAGAQVVRRVGAVLRAVAAAPEGSSTSQIATVAELARPTAHRLLVSLQAEGYLDRDGRTGLWFLGPELYLMGSVAAQRYDVTGRARDIVTELADRTGESAFFSARRGDETICLLRVDGSFPIRSFVLYEGARFPLGVASAGLVILSHLPDREQIDYLARQDLEKRWGTAHSANALVARIAETRARGYAVNPGLVVEGSFGMGAAVFSPVGRPDWALSITGVQHRFAPDRQPQLGQMLLKSAHSLTLALAGPRDQPAGSFVVGRDLARPSRIRSSP